MKILDTSAKSLLLGGFGQAQASSSFPNVLLSSFSNTGAIQFRGGAGGTTPYSQLSVDASAPDMNFDSTGGIWRWRSVLNDNASAQMQLETGGLIVKKGLKLNNSTDAFGNFILSFGNSANFNSGSAVYGLKGELNNDSSGSAYGLSITAGTCTTTVASDVAGAELGIRKQGATGSITNGYGLRINSPGTSAANQITNAYGIYIRAQKSSGVVNAYGIYQADAADRNYFAGSVGIGTSAPGSQLHMKNSSASAELYVEGAGNNFNNSALVLIATNGSNVRALGTYAFDVTGGTEWFSGRPYTGSGGSDGFLISRQTGLAAHNQNTASPTVGTPFFFINSSGNVGIGTVDPQVRLEVVGAAKLGSTGNYLRLQDYYVEKEFFISFSPNGVANQKCDLYFSGNLWGLLEVCLASDFANQNAAGAICKEFQLGLQDNGTTHQIYHQSTRYSAVSALTAANFAISDVTWDGNRWRIQIVHRTNTANNVVLRVRGYLTNYSGAVTNLANAAVSSIYTIDTAVFAAPVVSFDTPVSADAGITASVAITASLSTGTGSFQTFGFESRSPVAASSGSNYQNSPAAGLYASIWSGSAAVTKWCGLQVQGRSGLSGAYGLAIGSADQSALAWFDGAGGLHVGATPPTSIGPGIINAQAGFRINGVPAPFVPVGAIVGWVENLAGTPALPAGFQRCDGSAITDAASPYNGTNTPNLNGASGANPRFLRGSTTTGTTPTTGFGGNDSHTHAITPISISVASGSGASISMSPTATGAPTPTAIPAYYQVVWIMRIK
jgi:hypothetical protein